MKCPEVCEGREVPKKKKATQLAHPWIFAPGWQQQHSLVRRRLPLNQIWTTELGAATWTSSQQREGRLQKWPAPSLLRRSI